MHKLLRMAAPALLIGGMTMPAMAQTPSAGNATTAPATHDARAPANAPSEERGSDR